MFFALKVGGDMSMKGLTHSMPYVKVLLSRSLTPTSQNREIWLKMASQPHARGSPASRGCDPFGPALTRGDPRVTHSRVRISKGVNNRARQAQAQAQGQGQGEPKRHPAVPCGHCQSTSIYSISGALPRRQGPPECV